MHLLVQPRQQSNDGPPLERIIQWTLQRSQHGRLLLCCDAQSGRSVAGCRRHQLRRRVLHCACRSCCGCPCSRSMDSSVLPPQPQLYQGLQAEQ